MSGELARRYLQRAGMAGIIIGVLFADELRRLAAFDAVPPADATLRPLGRMLGAADLRLGAGLHLLLEVRAADVQHDDRLHRRLLPPHLVVQGGAAARAVLFGQLPGRAARGRGAALQHHHGRAPRTRRWRPPWTHKLEFVTDGATGWTDLFVRAVLCNFMINLAMLLVYNGLIKDDLTKSLAMIVVGLHLRVPRPRALGREHGAVHDRRPAATASTSGSRPRNVGDRAPRQLPRRRAAHRLVLRVRQRRRRVPPPHPLTREPRARSLSAENSSAHLPFAGTPRSVGRARHPSTTPARRRSTSMRRILFMVGTAVFGRIMAKRRENKAGGR